MRPIMETLTAYVRTKSPVQGASQSNQSYSSAASAYAMVVAEGTIKAAKEKVKYSSKNIGVDIQAVLIVITRRNISCEYNEYTKVTMWVLWREIIWDRILNFIRKLLNSRTRRRGKTFYYIKELIGLRAVKWDGPKQYINLSQTDLHGGSLSGGSLRGCSLFKTNLSGASLFNADLRYANLSYADLSGSFLRESNLSGAELDGVDLSGSFLYDANLSGADLYKVSLREASLFNADLSRTRLSNADLRWARLKNADLRWANLIDVDLRYADLSGADLSGAKLNNVKLENVTFCKTIMHDGTMNNRDCPPELRWTPEFGQPTEVS